MRDNLKVTRLRTMLVAGACFFAADVALARPRGFEGWKVLRVEVTTLDAFETLRALDAQRDDFELLVDGVRLGVLEARCTSSAQQLLANRGFEYEVWIDDLQSWYDNALHRDTGTDFFDTYRSHEEHVVFLNALVTAFPDLAEMVDLGVSVEGRHLWAIHITGPGADKPGVLYHGGQHGNEIMGPTVVAYLAEYLLTQYELDAQVRAVVDGVDWYLLTIMNPDGHHAGQRYNANGYDLNRNWGGPGSQPSPFSQPETAAIRDFFLAHPHIETYVDFHSSGRLILWPWGHTPDLCEDDPVYRGVGDQMSELIFTPRGSVYVGGPVNTTIYPVAGGSNDFAYGVLGLWSFTYELGYSHYMPPAEILPTCLEITPAVVYLAEWTLDCNENGVTDRIDISDGASTDCNENRTPDDCEPDFDGDTVIDVCDDDIDDDGVPNGSDDCPFTPLGVPVRWDGRPISDTSGNCHTDLPDYIRFRTCLLIGGPERDGLSGYCIQYFDVDTDGDVDMQDVSAFQQMFDAAEQP